MGEEDEESQESEELDSEDDFNPDYVQKEGEFIKTSHFFKRLLHFWKETRNIRKDLLIPSNQTVQQLNEREIPALIELIGQEARFKKYNTLRDLLRFLAAYN